MQISPSFAKFKSTKSKPVIIDKKNNKYDGLIWEDWKSSWYGDKTDNSNVDASGYIKKIFNSPLNNKTFKNKSVNLDYCPLIKSEKITGSVDLLEPSKSGATGYEFKFDGVDYTKAVIGEKSVEAALETMNSELEALAKKDGVYKN